MSTPTIDRTRVTTPFTPHPLVRAGDVQTALSKSKPSGLDLIEATERPVLLDAGYDYTEQDPGRAVRLLAYFTPAATATPARGLVLILHGWEGCSHSNYNLLATNAFIRAGFDVMRLNLRDHGPGLHVDPHALNKGLFFGTLIDEVATATRRIAEMAGDKPFYIVGASMGGNFALRLALRHGLEPFPNLRQVIALSPALNPGRATKAMDARASYRIYFRRRWSASLRRKQALFPELYDFDDVFRIRDVYEMTDVLIRRFGLFDSADDYFAQYQVRNAAFDHLSVPTTLITAADDPVIPVVDFYALPRHPLLDVQIHRYGGHVGWVDINPFRYYVPRLLLEALKGEWER